MVHVNARPDEGLFAGFSGSQPRARMKRCTCQTCIRMPLPDCANHNNEGQILYSLTTRLDKSGWVAPPNATACRRNDEARPWCIAVDRCSASKYEDLVCNETSASTLKACEHNRSYPTRTRRCCCFRIAFDSLHSHAAATLQPSGRV